MPRISFIMPAWKIKYLRQAIQSIVEQTYSDWELVVVDDCSPEDLRVIVNQFADGRIRYERNEKNIGGSDLVAQWNHSISFAKGEYIVLAADDDVYKPTFCEECVKLTEKYPDVDLIHSSVEQIDENGGHVWDDNIFPEYCSKEQYSYDWIRGAMFTCIGNYMFKRQALVSIGGFINFPCGFGSDIATPIALSEKGVANTQELLFCFRQSPEHLSADSSRFKEKLEAISLLSEWLQAHDYANFGKEHLRKKCVYDYFNLVIKYLPASKLNYLKYCRLATPKDKIMMTLRWIKKSIAK